MPTPDGYTKAIELFAKNLDGRPRRREMLRNMSTALLHLATQLQQDMALLKSQTAELGTAPSLRLGARSED